MKTKFLIIIFCIFLPAIAWGQKESNNPTSISQVLTVNYTYNNGVLDLKLNNKSSDEIFITNEKNYLDGFSYMNVKLLDENGNEIYKGRWSFGPRIYLVIYPNKTENSSYPFKILKVDQSKIKKIVLDVFIRCGIVGHNKTLFYEEKKEIEVN